MIRTIFAAIAFAIVSPTVASAASPGTSPFVKSWCGDMGIVLVESQPSIMDFADTIDDGKKADGYRRDSQKQVADISTQAKKCAPGRDRDLVAAYLNLWVSIENHHTGTEWRNDLNTSTQLFEKCVTSFYATAQGGKCETAVEDNVKRKMRWDSQP